MIYISMPLTTSFTKLMAGAAGLLRRFWNRVGLSGPSTPSSLD